MRSIDTSQSLRIAVLMEMLEDVSRAADAEGAFRAFARRIRRVRPIDAYVRVSTAGLRPGEFRVVRSHRARGGELETVEQGPRDVGRLPVRAGGFVGEVVRRRVPQLYQEMSLADDPALAGVAAGMGSCMCVPMFEGGRIDGWSLMFRADPRGYGLGDLEDDLLIGNLMGAITLNMASVERITELNGALREQFDQVARVQRALLPGALPRVVGVRFAASYQPSDQAGGDYYDFFEVGPEGDAGSVLGVLVADVSGHGPAAATIMAMLHAMLHARRDVCGSPGRALEFANARLAASSVEGTHVTAVYGVLDVRRRRLTVARAGHPLARVRRADGSVRAIGGGAGEGAAPMGIVSEGYEAREESVVLEAGDTVVLYTDGISEAENAAGEQLGLEGLDRAIAGAPDDPEGIIGAVRAAVDAHVGAAARGDDQTMVVFRMEG